ncbi:MAG TPA: hypothetical protein VGI70_12025 [Polyangiales bacterium]
MSAPPLPAFPALLAPPFALLAPPLDVPALAMFVAPSSAFLLVAWFSHALFVAAHKNKIEPAKSHERSRMLRESYGIECIRTTHSSLWLAGILGQPSPAFFKIV